MSPKARKAAVKPNRKAAATKKRTTGDVASVPGFRPTNAQRQFSVAYMEALTDGPPPVRDKDVAAAIRVTPQIVSHWRNHVPGFNAWLAAEIRSAVAVRWASVLAVALRLALRGSIDHMKFLRDILEPAPKDASTPAGSAGVFGGAIIINIPQPPAELEGNQVVRGLLEQAHTFDASVAEARSAVDKAASR